MKHLWIVCSDCLTHLTGGESKTIGFRRVKLCARCDRDIEHKSQAPVWSIIKTSIEPIGAKLVVKVEPAETVTKGGIIIPDSAQKRALIGRVVAMGPGMLMKNGGRWPMPDVVIGSRILFNRESSGHTFTIDGVKLLSLFDDNVLAEEESEAA